MAVAPAVGLYILHAVGFRTVSHLSALLVVGGFLLAFLFRYKQMDEVGETARRIAFIERSSIRPSLVIFFVSVTYGAINSFLSLYAKEKGIENIGVFFTVYAVSMLLSRPGFGLLVDRKGVSVAVVPGMILVMLAMYALHRAESLTMFLVAAALYGVGFGASQTSLQTMAVIHAPRERLGIANSTFFTGFDSGIGVGSVVLGMVSKRVGYSRMFLISAASVVVALLLFFIFSLEQSRMSKEK
jgi:predicted MFS family arabinose efflux permease